MTLNDIMVNLKESDVAELEFKPATPGSAVRYTMNCANGAELNLQKDRMTIEIIS